MKKIKLIKTSNTINFISKVITILVLLYLAFAQHYGYFFMLSTFNIVLSVLEITEILRNKAHITLHISQTSLKETDASELAKQILKQLDALEKKGR